MDRVISLFISYSRVDEVVVKELVRGLESAGMEPWVDEALKGGDSWWDTILNRIERASVFLFAVSDSSLKSKPCRSEHDYARRLGLPIVPVQVGTCGSFRMADIFALQAVVFDPADAASAFEIVAAINYQAGKPRNPVGPQPPDRPPIPYEYLMRLNAEIEAGQLTPPQQVSVVDQLRHALEDEQEEEVQADIRNMLGKVETQPWATVVAAREARRVLDEHPAKSSRPAPAWYPDPTGRYSWRWFENEWTQWVAARGNVVADPIQFTEE